MATYIYKKDLQEIEDPTISELQRTIYVTDSVDNAEILLGICEGDIEGLEEGAKSFYVGDTPLQHKNGTYNFKDFTLTIMTGSGFGEVVDFKMGGNVQPHSVGQALAAGYPIIVYGTHNNIDFIDVRIVVNYLLDSANKKGKLRDYSADLKIEYQRASEGDTWHNILGVDQPVKLLGKVTSNTVVQFRIKVDRVNEPYVLRVSKMWDADGDSYHNDVTFESFYEGVADQREFPYTALAHVYLRTSDQLSSIPNLSGVYKLLKIRVPSNYDPVNRTYSGEWDGTFKLAWSDNPAWCLYDFVMNDRYGMNAYAKVVLDKWDCYEAGQWCDEMVSDGKGGLEPRFTCNLVQSEATNGREFITYLAGLFQAFLVEPATGYLRLFVDKDAEPVFLFTPENVTEQGFSYSFTNPETRYNDIKVSFINTETNWESDTRRLIDYIDPESETYARLQDDINANGLVTYDFIAVGCIREGEALRRAFYRLNTALNEKTQVSFTTNRQAQCLSDYDIILISDPVLGYAISGRVKSISEDRRTIYLRDSIYIENNQDDFTIRFNTPDGIYEDKLVQPENIGRTKELQLQNPLPENLPEAATFSISSGKFGMAKPFRITSIVESEGNPDQYVINAIELDRGKWEAADNLQLSNPTDYSGLPSSADVPHILDLSFYLVYNPVDMQTELTLTPTYVETYPYYSGNIQVYTRLKNTNTWVRQDTVRNTVVEGLEPGEYDFIVLPISTTGITPLFETAPIFTYTVAETNLIPSNIKNLKADPNANGVVLTWDPVDDLDLAGYEIRAGEDWETGEVIITNYAGTSYYVPVTDADTQYYMVAAKNYMGNYSAFPAFVSSAVTAPDDVPVFYATVSNDRVRFDWEQVEGTDIEYEIRLGNNWNTAQKVASIKGNNTTVLLPSGAHITYCIKAKSPVGLYSKNPRYTQPDMLLKPDRNIILRYDNGGAGFPGYTYNFEPFTPPGSEEPYENMLQMSNTAVYAEHYFSVTLDKETRARNWLETTAFSNPQRYRWVDLPIRYSSEQAHMMWIGAQNLESDGSIQAVIAKWRGLSSWSGDIAFSYANTTADVLQQITPTESESIQYTDGYLSNALVLDGDTYLKYENMDIPDIFSIHFKLKIKNPEEERTESFQENINLITLANNNDSYLRLYVADGQVVCKGSDGIDIVTEFTHANDLDYVTIALIQSETERVLYFYSDYVMFESYKVVEAAPIGGFSKYYVNKKLGEIL